MIPQYLYTASFPTGSNYICNPPVTDTDIDYMFLVRDLEQTYMELLNKGWKRCGDDEYGLNEWSAYRKDKYNALVTVSPKYFNLFLKATEKAKLLNLLKKEDRIKLFNDILNKGKEPKQNYNDEVYGMTLTEDNLVEAMNATFDRW